MLGLTGCRIGQARNFHLPQLILVLNRLGISTEELDSSNWRVGKSVEVFSWLLNDVGRPISLEAVLPLGKLTRMSKRGS